MITLFEGVWLRGVGGGGGGGERESEREREMFFFGEFSGAVCFSRFATFFTFIPFHSVSEHAQARHSPDSPCLSATQGPASTLTASSCWFAWPLCSCARACTWCMSICVMSVYVRACTASPPPPHHHHQPVLKLKPPPVKRCPPGGCWMGKPLLSRSPPLFANCSANNTHT